MLERRVAAASVLAGYQKTKGVQSKEAEAAAENAENAETEKVEGQHKVVSPMDSASTDRFNPVFYTMLLGTYDVGSDLSILFGHDDVIGLVFGYVTSWWKSHIIQHPVTSRTRGVYASKVGHVTFPQPSGININMMPFVMGETESIPNEYRHYVNILASCPINRQEWGKIGYLTIHESIVTEEGASQRRHGLHTETPGRLRTDCLGDEMKAADVGGAWQLQKNPPMTIPWGRGFFGADKKFGHYVGGIFMASNVSDSTRVWNCKVDAPAEIVGSLGDLEHLRGVLGEGATLASGDVLWMTDTTPHESLPLKAGTHRQYFRLVTSDIGVWYSQHSTPNPLGSVPGKDVRIITDSKFVPKAPTDVDKQHFAATVAQALHDAPVGLDAAFLKSLLAEPARTAGAEADRDRATFVSQTCTSVSDKHTNDRVGPVLQRPYYRALAHALFRAALNSGVIGAMPPPNDPVLVDLLVDEADDQDRWTAAINTLLLPALRNAAFYGPEVAAAVRGVLGQLGHRGICCALGLRRTTGTVAGALPPPTDELLASFMVRHTDGDKSLDATLVAEVVGQVPALQGHADLRSELARHTLSAAVTDLAGRIKAARATDKMAQAALVLQMRPLRKLQHVICKEPPKLTVGARALCKHADRGTERFWTSGGSLSGPPALINERAQYVLSRVLELACWGNIHQLPGDLPTFELRTPRGYGARWTIGCSDRPTQDATGAHDGVPVFRGFLEPHHVNGHETGWKHTTNTASAEAGAYVAAIIAMPHAAAGDTPPTTITSAATTTGPTNTTDSTTTPPTATAAST